MSSIKSVLILLEKQVIKEEDVNLLMQSRKDDVTVDVSGESLIIGQSGQQIILTSEEASILIRHLQFAIKKINE